MLSILFLIAGLTLLIGGGDALVRGAVGVAERFHVPGLIIGLTIVAIGTSAPEMFVSVRAALNGAGGIAVGNVVGSNIANVLLVLGLPALVKATNCREDGIGRNLLTMLGLTALLMAMMAKGNVGRLDGAILLGLLCLFLWLQYRWASRHRRNRPESDSFERKVPKRTSVIAAMLLFGMLALPLGADLTVRGATDIARWIGLSEEVIGLTVIAVGTSLPELATSVLAVYRGNTSVALGNVVGSNIFNIAAIMGVTTAIVPVPIRDRVIDFDMWVMAATALLLAIMAHYHWVLTKRHGAVMVATYFLYVASAIWVN